MRAYPPLSFPPAVIPVIDRKKTLSYSRVDIAWEGHPVLLFVVLLIIKQIISADAYLKSL